MKRLLVFGFLALPVLGGCSVMNFFGYPDGVETPYNPKDTRGDVSVKRDIQFSDIPVPIGFILRRDSTFSFQGTSFRFGRYTYEGAWTLRKTTEFYKEQMPGSGWRLLESNHAFDIRASEESDTLVYAKGRERVRLYILSTPEGITVQIRLYNVSVQNSVPGASGEESGPGQEQEEEEALEPAPAKTVSDKKASPCASGRCRAF